MLSNSTNGAISTVESDSFLALIENKINQKIKEHQKEVSGVYSEWERNSLGKELTKEEYEKLLDDLTYKSRMVPSEYDTGDAINLYRISVAKEIEMVKRDMDRMLAFQRELESYRTELFKTLPRNINQVISNCKNHLSDTITDYLKDLVMDYCDLFVDSIRKLCPKDVDYTKTIETVYNSRNSQKSVETIKSYFDKLENMLSMVIYKFEDYDSNKADKLETLQNYLKHVISSLICDFHCTISDFIQKNLNKSRDNQEMNDVRTVKLYAQLCINTMSKKIVQELPKLLDERMKSKFDDLLTYKLPDFSTSKLGYSLTKPDNKELQRKALPCYGPVVVEEVDGVGEVEDTDGVGDVEVKDEVKVEVEPKSKEKTFDDFLKTLTNDPIENSVLLELYNEYFNKKMSLIGFGKLKDVKDNFTVNRRTVKGVRSTYYQKLRNRAK